MHKTIETRPFYRAADISRGDIDEATRTVKVLFSSEFGVERYIDGIRGIEILDHGPGSVDMSRMKDGAAVLINHDWENQVGVVDDAEIISTERVGRAVLRLGRSQLASEVLTDVVDRVRRAVSVGYRVLKYVVEQKGDETFFRVTKWQPYEVSFVSIAADPTAQVGRADTEIIKTEVIRMETNEANDNDGARALEVDDGATVDITAVREEAKRQETNRIRDIVALGEQHDCRDLAEKARDDNWSVAKMQREILDHLAERQRERRPVTEIGLSNRELQSWSLIRACNAHLNKDWKKAGLELEVSRAIADKVGRDPAGFYVPYEVQAAGLHKRGERVMTAGTDAAGGYMVATELAASSFIDLLRANVLLTRLNARVLPGLVGDVDIPRLDGGVAFNWVTEDADATPDDATLGVVSLTPKTIAGEVPISRRLLKQSTPSVEQMLLDDMSKGAALAIDLAGFEGSGAAGQPTGVKNTAGIGTVTILPLGQPTHAEVVEFETDVLTANALNGTLAYVTTPSVRGFCKTSLLDAGSGRFLLENGEMNGYPVAVTTQLSVSTDILFGNWEDVVIGMWGMLDVEPDRAEKAAAGGLVLRVFQDVDIGVRHAGSFSKQV